MNLLLISNSTNAGEQYLQHCIDEIKVFLGNCHNIVFVPYAAVTFSYDAYENKVNEKFNAVGLECKSIHRFENPQKALEEADTIVVGGGNTFMLLHLMYENEVLETIKQKVLTGTKYVGWSAGSNVACPTIRTTNDMPIIQPASFKAMNFVHFQINPHYLDANPEGHAGETRQQRIEEFIEVNRDVYVVGLREGTMLKIDENSINLIGSRPARIFRYGQQPFELTSNDDFSFLMNKIS